MIDLFETKEKQTEAIISFSELIKQPGWKLFEAILDENIKFLTDSLVDDNFVDAGDIKATQLMLKAYTNAKNIPQDRIEDFSSTDEGGVPNLDSYESLADFRANLERGRKRHLTPKE